MSSNTREHEIEMSEKQAIHPLNEDFVNLSDKEQARLIEYNQSVADAEGEKGKRILFERAPEETLPFIAYCIFVSANALVATIVLITQSQVTLPYYLIIAGSMIFPLFALPSGSFSDTLSWAKETVLG